VLARALGLQGIEGTEEMTKRMTRVTLRHHFRTMIKYEARPAVLYSKKATAVDMILIAVTRSEACVRIKDYNGTTKHSKVIEEVEIALVNGERVNVGTYVYVWNEPLSYMESTH
jgi:hypothetical protein